MTEWLIFLIVACAGLLAGFIDAIVGGAALITVPVLLIVLQSSVLAIGTSKISGFLAAFIAWLVYWKKGYMDFSKGCAFGIWTGIGSILGSSAAPLFPEAAFKWLMLALCPLLLWIILHKDTWTHTNVCTFAKPIAPPPSFSRLLSNRRYIFSGLACGFYDGFLGAAGGTFMFLALFLITHSALLPALAIAKFVNWISSVLALGNYALMDSVDWEAGMVLAVFIAIGAFLGAHLASKNATKIVRPLLIAIVGLLLLYLLIH